MKPSLALRLLFLVCLVLVTIPIVSCRRDPTKQVVVYCAHDREFAQEILDEFQKQSGLEILVSYDNEANKAVAMKDALIREASSPRCDVHWNNEIIGTIDLQKRGVLEPY